MTEEYINDNLIDIVLPIPEYTYHVDAKSFIKDGIDVIKCGALYNLKEIIEACKDYEFISGDNDDQHMVVSIPKATYQLTVECQIATDAEPRIEKQTFTHKDIFNFRKKYLELDPEEELRTVYHITPLFKQFLEQFGDNWIYEDWDAYRLKHNGG